MSVRAPGAHGHDSRFDANRLGILAMTGAMACFIVNDALVKYASQTMPAAQLIFVRGVMASLLVLAAAQAMGATRRIREVARGWVAVRAVVDAVATVLFLVSLFHLPLANATAINMASPLFITVLAAIFLGERLGPPRWLAVGIGFLGVLLIIQPQAESFNAYALVCLLATVLLSVRDLLTGGFTPRVPSILITLSNTFAVTLLAGGLSLIEGWRPFGAFEMGLLAVAAVFLCRRLLPHRDRHAARRPVDHRAVPVHRRSCSRPSPASWSGATGPTRSPGAASRSSSRPASTCCGRAAARALHP